MPVGRRPPGGFERGDVLRKVTTLSPDELQELLVLIDHAEQGGVHLTGEGTLSVGPPLVAEATIAQHLPAIVQKVTATFSTSWNVEAPEVQTTEGTATARASASAVTERVPQGYGSGTFGWTGSGSGYAPPIQSEAVKSLWESIRPANATDAVAYLQEMRKWVLIILFVVIGGASSQDVWDALEKAFSSVVESVGDEAGTEANPGE